MPGLRGTVGLQTIILQMARLARVSQPPYSHNKFIRIFGGPDFDHWRAKLYFPYLMLIQAVASGYLSLRREGDFQAR